MRKTWIVAQTVIVALLTSSAFSAPIQQVNVTNMLWNANATSGVPGITPTSIVANFYNGGTKPCFTITIAFKGSTTVQAGTGLPCVTAITSVSFTPVAGPVGAVYTTPPDTAINGSYYTTQLIVQNGTDPVFDTTNGAVKTEGVVSISSHGQLAAG
jgi:hypothetical protein